MTKQELYEKALILPLLPGVYIIRDKSNEVIYVGKAKRLRTRVSQYFREGVPHDEKVTRMIGAAHEFDVIITNSENEALILECSQIKQHSPKYNILLKDDKGYSYVRVSAGDYPRITGELQRREDGATYLGPYTSSFAVRQMVETANIAFKLPTCNRKLPDDIGKRRPCLNYHIGRCMAPCTGKISKSEYAVHLNGALRLIKQGKNEILASLRKDMAAASDRLDFERAANIRDQITAIERVRDGQVVISDNRKEEDIVALTGNAAMVCAAVLRFREGRLVDKKEFLFKGTADIEKTRDDFLAQYYVGRPETPKSIAVDEMPQTAEALQQVLSEQRGNKVKIYRPEKGDTQRLVQMAYINATERLAREAGRGARDTRALDELAGLLGLEKAPVTIESYDISNWGEGTSVCGMVVMENGKPKKSGYRRFKIKTVQGTDDYASLAEVLARRTAQYEAGGAGQFAIKPDLILLDGGKGQVSSVRAVLRGTAFEDVPLYGMVKDSKHRTRALTDETGEIAIAMNRGVFTFVTKLQDEVHRFALAYQQESQKKKTFSSPLTKLPGVGPATAKALMQHFKTVKALQSAELAQIAAVKGVSAAAAKSVYQHYHPTAKP